MQKGFNKHELLLYAAGSLALMLAVVYFFVPEEKSQSSTHFISMPRSKEEDFTLSKTAAYKRKQYRATASPKPVKLNLKLSNRAERQQKVSTRSEPAQPRPKPKVSNKKSFQSPMPASKPKRHINTGFYGWSKQTPNKVSNNGYTPATVDNDLIVQQGAKVRIRLLAETVIQGVEIPRHTFVSGIIERHRDHIDIIVSHIQVKGKHIETRLLAYDDQYHRGILISTDHDLSLQDALTSELIEEATRAVPFSRVASLAGKLFSKKTRKGEKIVIPDGFRIFLKQATSEEAND